MKISQLANFENQKTQNSEFQNSVSSDDAKIANAEISRDEENGACEICGSEKFWKPRQSSQWFCENCKPPKFAALVDQRRGPDQAPSLAVHAQRDDEREQILTFGMCRPVCDACCCHMIDELWREAWIDGRWIGVELIARTCTVCGSAILQERIIGGVEACLDLIQRGKNA